MGCPTHPAKPRRRPQAPIGRSGPQVAVGYLSRSTEPPRAVHPLPTGAPPPFPARRPRTATRRARSASPEPGRSNRVSGWAKNMARRQSALGDAFTAFRVRARSPGVR